MITALKLYGFLILLGIGAWLLYRGYRQRVGGDRATGAGGIRLVLLSLLPTLVILVDLLSFYDVGRWPVLLTGTVIAIACGVASWYCRRAIAAQGEEGPGLGKGTLLSLGILALGLVLLRGVLGGG